MVKLKISVLKLLNNINKNSSKLSNKNKSKQKQKQKQKKKKKEKRKKERKTVRCPLVISLLSIFAFNFYCFSVCRSGGGVVDNTLDY